MHSNQIYFIMYMLGLFEENCVTHQAPGYTFELRMEIVTLLSSSISMKILWISFPPS
jgi:hypothetical protein